MSNSNVFRPVTAAVLAALVSIGCYSTAALRVQVRTGTDDQQCVRTTDRVFANAGFERVRTVIGPDMFYTPRTNPGAEIALGWGIGAWLNRNSESESCAVTIEAVSLDPAAGLERPLSSQRGEYFDATVRDMAKRLEVAFAAP